MITLRDANGNLLMNVSETGEVKLTDELIKKSDSEVIEQLIEDGRIADSFAPKKAKKKKKKKEVEPVIEDEEKETENSKE